MTASVGIMKKIGSSKVFLPVAWHTQFFHGFFVSFVGRLHAHRAFVDAIVFVPRIGLHRPRITSGRFSKALDSELKKQGLDGDWGDCSGPEQTVHRY